jgi:D-alanyl-lipoteichoic acid acyltransferase DltB (MBOAT superfamily)
MLLAASCYFYMFFVPVYILILAITILIDYFAGILIEDSPQKNKKMLLYVSLIANIGVLCVFKYYNFFISNIEDLLASLNITTYKLPYLTILLPIGLSFHTFQAMSYTLEVYKGKQKAERHFGIYALYVMFFPQLVAGPIERPQQIFPQFHFSQPFDWSNIVSGLRFILLGLFKKIVVADQLNVMVSYVFDNPHNVKGATIYIGCLFFVIQVYCDFSGYSDIARGSAKLLGINLMENFNLPFFAKSYGNFWAKWHISLMNWFRDYIMFPLIRKKWKWPFVFMLVFVISGFWHGANWTFIVWGIYNGLLLIYSKSTEDYRAALINKLGLSKAKNLRHIIQSICIFNMFAFSAVFFRAHTISDSFILIENLFTGFSDSISKIISNHNDLRQHVLYLGKDSITFGLILLYVFLLEFFQWNLRHKTLDAYINGISVLKRNLIYIFTIFSIILMANLIEAPFVYFQF